MTPEELIAIAQRAFPVESWRVRLAEHLRVSQSTVWRWTNGKIAIPHPVALAVRALTRADPD
jgi:hypothetical protein